MNLSNSAAPCRQVPPVHPSDCASVSRICYPEDLESVRFSLELAQTTGFKGLFKRGE